MAVGIWTHYRVSNFKNVLLTMNYPLCLVSYHYSSIKAYLENRCILSSTISRPKSIGFPLSSAILSNVSKAVSLCPEAALKRADSGSHVEAAITKARLGSELKAKSQRQPPVVIIKAARRTSRQAPKAQKQSIKMTHLARCLVGRNSANKVTDWGTQPMLKPTKNLKNRIQL